MTDDRIQRFREALQDALRERGLDPAHPITVAEIYQDLVPYRTHRDRLGVEMNGDYEHLLLRALAGQGGVLEIQSNAALEQLRDELESNNPNTGLYREFAAVDVRISVSEAREPAVAPDSAPMPAPAPAPEPMALSDLAPDTTGMGFSPPAPSAPSSVDEEPLRVVPPRMEAAHVSDEERACQWCRQILPDRPNLNFCPFCGTDLRIVPCPSCGEALEPGWRFCIACGDEVPATA